MDELLILGCIALFFALVVVPVLAIVAFNRSSAVRSELETLRRGSRSLSCAVAQKRRWRQPLRVPRCLRFLMLQRSR
jgi:hypothetical protein